MLQRHGVLAYMNGHDHNLQHLRVEEGGLNGGGGVHLLCSGAGSSARTSGQRPDAQPCDVLFYEDREPGFMLVQIMEDGDVRVAFMDRKNRLLYETMLR
jgi:acid phosphatase